MRLVDVHAHLDLEQYDSDLKEVVERAESAGLKTVINCGTSPESNRRTLELAEEYGIVKPALGYYPTSVVEDGLGSLTKELRFIEKKQSEITAISEVGLEFQKVSDKNKREVMVEAFKRIVQLSNKTELPMIIHSRKAEEEAVDILEENCKHDKIVMHCFCGSKELVKRVIKNKWMISLPTNLVKLQQFQDIIRDHPLSRLLTETDSPYLSPYKDKRRNEPSFVKESIKKIAEIKEVEEEVVADKIFENYQRVF